MKKIIKLRKETDTSKDTEKRTIKDISDRGNANKDTKKFTAKFSFETATTTRTDCAIQN